ncbi:MAG: DUF2344 domain-containing protein [Phycisphaerae bacterium]|nr:DUF2344 domain-containing protein [Phycisphaerae bacterium]
MTDNPIGSEVQKYRLVLWFTIKRDRRFLSHRDTVKLWQQTFSRCEVPLRYTQGFNPRIRLSLPMPRNVAIASDCELLIVELTEQLEIDSFIAKINANLPANIEVTHGRYAAFDEPLYPTGCTYALSIAKEADLAKIAGNIDKFNAMEKLVFTRPSRGRHPVKYLDLKVTVGSLELNGNTINLSMNIFRTGTSRIDELMSMLGIDMIKDITFIQRTKAVFGKQIELEQNIEII